MSHTHEAGWAHASGALRGPSWLREPGDPNALVQHLWSSTAAKLDGVLEVGGVRLSDLVAEHGSPAYVLDEVDFRARAAAFREGFHDFDVFYAGKAFLCTTVARWIDEEGLHLDVCTGGELAVAERAGFPMQRVGFHGNNKSVAELERAVRLGVGRIIVDSFHEIERLTAVTADLGREVGVMVRVTAGVEAHTHEYIATAHEDQKFGFSITSGDALEAQAFGFLAVRSLKGLPLSLPSTTGGYKPTPGGGLLGAVELGVPLSSFENIEPRCSEPRRVADRLASLGYDRIVVARLAPEGAIPVVKVFVPGLGSLHRERRAPT